MRDPGSMSVRCVIVDDSNDFLRAASDLLERAGITVVGVAQTGAQAGRVCGDLQPDVVLLDIELGDESGFDVARQLTGDVSPDQPYVILTSAHSAEDFTDMMADTPVVSFLPKSALSGPAVLAILADAHQPGSGRHRDSR
jgi:CheY-like chemotaxis protein